MLIRVNGTGRASSLADLSTASYCTFLASVTVFEAELEVILRSGSVFTKVGLPKGSRQQFFASQNRRKALQTKFDRFV